MDDLSRRFRSLFLGYNAVLVLIASGAIGGLLFLHWEDVVAAEILLFLVVSFLVLPGVVYLLYLRFQDALASAVDSADRAQAESQSRQRELAQIHDSLVDPMISIDMKGTVLTANPAVERVFEWVAGDLIGENVRVLMAEPYRSEHDTYIKSYLDTGVARAIGTIRKVMGLRASGAEFPCELSVSRADGPDGPRFVGVVRDVSEREQMAAMLSHAERLAAVGELAAGVAHEVNNPVNTIINCAQLVKDGDDDPSLQDDIIHEGMRIAAIVRDLLDFSRDHSDEFGPTDIAAVVERTMSLVSRRIHKQGIEVEVDVPAKLPHVHGRAQQLQQVLLNLLLNARDALVHDPREYGKRIRVTASLAASGRAVQVRVRDNGPGIAAENLDRVFQPFFTTKREHGGSGLGLAVSLGIVRSHEGTLEVETVPGERTEFIVSLPI